STLVFAFLADLHLRVLPPASAGDFLVVDVRWVWSDTSGVGAQLVFLDCAPVTGPVAVKVGRDLVGVVDRLSSRHRATTGEGLEVGQGSLSRGIRQDAVLRNLRDTSEVVKGALARELEGSRPVQKTWNGRVELGVQRGQLRYTRWGKGKPGIFVGGVIDSHEANHVGFFRNFIECYAQIAPLRCGTDIAKLKLTSVGDLITLTKGAVLQGQLHAFLLNVIDVVVVDIARGRYCQNGSVFTGLIWQVVPLRGHLRGTALGRIVGAQNRHLGVVQVERQVHG